ncbi:hypothetical protein COW06_02965 [Candidatus Gracilibacteria bacterium CG12_big_fil_rev_8_21_14_0_65_38_15]|nr:MAG: hypothetical protein COW68_03250 [Candidatus Gracilibacteria bacterium CG18_big_fil_WC_8_21_14_2_50_38_16]PIQ41426.1 MAG: hypothetical protein COW06_02965 [Candidatus Gracilibacteria bacterium CG12_big_fil_rev_8_21_14_0_65_38_15]PIZ02099.1 MAG: hypothetical protein COY60_00105 [Candidatus Gracilibacteria bacterium CG_4_10_14_0_8_um_filter_38_28]
METKNNPSCHPRENGNPAETSTIEAESPVKPRMTTYKGFTLVELIVVITILTILGTIGFVQMDGFASSTRDSRRVSDMSNITQAIELAVITQGSAPVPSGAVPYTGGLVTIQMGKADNSSIPKMSGDFSDPLTHEAYNYSIFGNGNYYQIGIDFENPLSFEVSIPFIGIERVYAADTSLKYSKLSGNYTFDPSLPSLFFLTGGYNTASGGIFSPDICFIMENSSTNTFSSNSETCVPKKDVILKNLDSGLVGYWDMESYYQSGSLYYLKDISGNNNDGIFSGGLNPTAIGTLSNGITGKGINFGTGFFIQVANSDSLNISGTGSAVTISVLFRINILDTFVFHNIFYKGTNGGGCSEILCSNRL